MKPIFKPIYKKTSTGKIQMWEVIIEGTKIITRSGQVGGKIQEHTDIIKKGKNIGKVNETTPEQQAISEATSKYEKKLKEGYVTTIEDAKNNKTSEYVEGGYLPMLAKVYEKDKKHIVFPCASQPKLDGIRCCYTGGDKLWTRTRKEILGVPHINEYMKVLGKHFPQLDGELYNHKYKDNFEKIVKIVKQTKKLDPDHKIVQYHIYDIPSNKDFRERMKDLKRLAELAKDMDGIVVVPTKICKTEEELMRFADRCLEVGYEGAMARNLKGEYQYKRSFNLQKIKIFNDDEFTIVGVEEGRGKLAGHAGSFICKTKDGVEFKAKLKGKLDDLKEYLVNFDKYKGRLLTVQYQGLTNKNNVPRFPVGLRIREDM